LPNKDVQEQAGRAAAFSDGVVHRSREQDFGACGEAGPAVDWEQTFALTSGERNLWIWDIQIFLTFFGELFEAVFSSKFLNLRIRIHLGCPLELLPSKLVQARAEFSQELATMQKWNTNSRTTIPFIGINNSRT